MIGETEIVVRLVIAALLGGLVGLEREFHAQPAGLRTHMILAIGAALAMCLSIRLAIDFRAVAPNGDPARLAAQVLSGIGFLGAGAIFRYGTSVKGLTTATSLWTIAVVGLAVGAGHFGGAVTATILLLVVLAVVDRIEKRFVHARQTRRMVLRAKDRPRLVEEVERLLAENRIETKSIGVEKDLETGEIEIEATVKIPAAADVDRIVGLLSRIDGARRFEVE